jgi:hypothetical protein
LFSTEPVIKTEYQLVADNFNILDENITAIKGAQNTIVVSRVDGMGVRGRELY